MRIGFTGTQRGMTPDQVVMVTHILSENYEEDSVFIHGGCIGADDEAAGADCRHRSQEKTRQR
jgi:hypothetical protein